MKKSCSKIRHIQESNEKLENRFVIKEEDKKIRERIEVKNSLESYCLNMKKLIFDEAFKEKLTEDDKKLIESET